LRRGSIAQLQAYIQDFCVQVRVKEVSRSGAIFFAHGGKEVKTPLEPTVQDSLCYMQINSEVKRK
jgi:hypothetical protein